MTESKYSNFDYELSKKILNLLKVRITFNFKLVMKMHDISFSMKEKLWKNMILVLSLFLIIHICMYSLQQMYWTSGDPRKMFQYIKV